MKRFLFAIVLLYCVSAQSQSIYPIRADKIVLEKVGGSAELVLKNSTRDSSGFLFNTGGGITQFRRALHAIDDSTYLIGGDTLHVHSGGTGGTTSPAGSFGQIQFNRFDQFAATDSLLLYEGILSYSGIMQVGLTASNAGRLQVNSDDKSRPFFTSGPSGFNFNSVVDPGTASDGWTAYNKLYGSVDTATNNTTSHKRFNTTMKKTTLFPQTATPVSQTFKFGNGSDWTLILNDTARLNPQVSDGISGFRSRMAFTPDPSHTGNMRIRVGTDVGDYSSMVLGVVEIKGTSSGNHISILGAPGANNTTSTMGGLAGFISYPLADGGNLDTIRNWVGFYSGGSGTPNMPHTDILIDFLGSNLANNRLHYFLYGPKGTLSDTSKSFIGGKLSIDPTGADTIVSMATLNVRGTIRMIDGNQGAGKVLTSDANGIGTWQIPSGGGGGSGTVTSIVGGYGINGGTITSTGTFKVDTVLLTSREWHQKAIDSLAALIPTADGNIYDNDGALAGDRVLDMNGHQLLFSNTSDFQVDYTNGSFMTGNMSIGAGGFLVTQTVGASTATLALSNGGGVGMSGGSGTQFFAGVSNFSITGALPTGGTPATRSFIVIDNSGDWREIPTDSLVNFTALAANYVPLNFTSDVTVNMAGHEVAFSTNDGSTTTVFNQAAAGISLSATDDANAAIFSKLIMYPTGELEIDASDATGSAIIHFHRDGMEYNSDHSAAWNPRSIVDKGYVDGAIAAIPAGVTTSRTISTTSPLAGGGDLSANRTLSIADAVADGSTKGAATFTAADFNAASGVISIDYTNGQAASGSNKGFLTSADWTTFNSKAATTVTISTTSPLSGGGDLSTNRTLSIANAAADGTTKGAATFTAADFDATTGLISIDYTNGQAATGSVKGFLTAADWTTFNGKVGTSVTTLSSLASIGTITTGTWNGSVIAGTYGGTGVNNGVKTITLGGNLTTTGAFNTNFTVTGSNTITFPNASITVARTDAAQTFTGVQTLSSFPVVGGFTNTGTLTLPTVTGTIMQINKTTTASSATPTPTGDAAYNHFTVTALAANATFAAPSGTPAEGNQLLIRVKDNATPRTLAWNAVYRASTDLSLPSSTTTSKDMYIRFIYNSTTSTWDMTAFLDNF